jgi:hypothetical protein
MSIKICTRGPAEPVTILTIADHSRALPIGELAGHPRIWLDTALFAAAIEPNLTDAELRDYERGADEVRYR